MRRLDEVYVETDATVEGPLTPASIRQRSGAVPLALLVDGDYRTQPAEDETIAPGMTIIALGTKEQLGKLRHRVTSRRVGSDTTWRKGWPYD